MKHEIRLSMSGVVYIHVHKYQRWARKGHVIFTGQLFMESWGRGKKIEQDMGTQDIYFYLKFLIFLKSKIICFNDCEFHLMGLHHIIPCSRYLKINKVKPHLLKLRSVNLIHVSLKRTRKIPEGLGDCTPTEPHAAPAMFS